MINYYYYIVPLLTQLSSSQGQPGTIIECRGCFPPTCGDNSSSYSITVGGIQAHLLSIGNRASVFYMHLLPVNSSIPNAQINLISQYGTVYTFPDSPSLNMIDYRQYGTAVSNLSPSSGQTGTMVTFTGSNLIGLGGLNIELTSVSFDGISANIIDSSGTQVTVRVPYGVAIGNISIQFNSTQYINSMPYDGPYAVIEGLWTQVEDGSITLLIPPAAQPNTTLYVCGQRLMGGGSNITNLSIAGTPSDRFPIVTIPNITNDTTDCISTIIPYAATNGPVNITSDTGAIVSTVNGLIFQYANITSVTPSEGQEYTYVFITGTHLLSGYPNLTPTVYFNGIQSLVFSYTTDRIIVQPLPTNDTNQYTDLLITVANYGLTFDLSYANAWRYLPPGQVTMVTPSYGQYGTVINVTGINLLGYGTGIEIINIIGTGNSPMTITALYSSDTYVLLSIPLPVNVSYIGPVDITLVSSNGARVTGTDVFQYRERGYIQSVTPSQGQTGTYGKLYLSLF